MTENYIELLSLIKKSRLVEGYGTKLETALMLTLLSSLVDKKDGESLDSETCKQSLFNTLEKHGINIKIQDVEDIRNCLLAQHTSSPELSLELLENLYSGFLNHFQKISSKSHKIFNVSILILVAVMLVAYYSIDRLLHPPVAKITYFSNKDLLGTPYAEEYGPLPTDVDFAMNAPKKGMPADNFSIRYESDMTLTKDTTINLSTVSDDGVRVYVDDVIVMDYWVPQDSIQNTKSLPLTAGKHRIKIEYFEALVGAKLSVKIYSPIANNLEFDAP